MAEYDVDRKTSMESPSSIPWSLGASSGRSLVPLKVKRTTTRLRPCLPQYAIINFLSGVVYLILKLTVPFWSLTCRSSIKMISEN